VNGNSPADDCRLNEKISRRDFLKLMFAAPLAITLLPLTQLTRVFGSNVSNADVIDRYRFGEVDKFGIKKIYSTKPNGLEWFANWDKTRVIKSNQSDPYDSRLMITCGTKTDNGLFIGDGKAKFKALDESPRIWIKGPWLNTEQTVYIKVLPNGKATSIELRSRSNHNGANRLPYPDGRKSISCGFGNYDVLWGYEQLDTVSIELEIMHGLYRRHLIDKPLVIPKDKYIGFKSVVRNVENGNVKVEGYNNMDTSSQSNWKKTVEFLFDGSNAAVTDSTLEKHQRELDYCKDKGDKISGDLNNHQIWNKPSYWNWIRINNAKNIDLKYYSVREIQ
jgi:hypothetical protein